MLTSGGVDSVTTAYYVKKRLKAPKMMLVFATTDRGHTNTKEFCIKAIGKALESR